MKYLSFLFLIFILISCKGKSTIEERFVYKISSSGSIKKHILKLSVIKKDSIIDYKYEAKDSIKSFGFRYYLNNEILVGNDVYKYKNKEILLKNLKFKVYGLSKNELVSHPRFIVFRKDYGIIANVAYGADFLFLKDTILDKNDIQLFDKIIEKL